MDDEENNRSPAVAAALRLPPEALPLCRERRRCGCGGGVDDAEVDYACWRVETGKACRAPCAALQDGAERARRPWSAAGVSVSRLREPLDVHAPDRLPELPAPKEGSAYATGWEHIEAAPGPTKLARAAGALPGRELAELDAPVEPRVRVTPPGPDFRRFHAAADQVLADERKDGLCGNEISGASRHRRDVVLMVSTRPSSRCPPTLGPAARLARAERRPRSRAAKPRRTPVRARGRRVPGAAPRLGAGARSPRRERRGRRLRPRGAPAGALSRGGLRREARGAVRPALGEGRVRIICAWAFAPYRTFSTRPRGVSTPSSS